MTDDEITQKLLALVSAGKVKVPGLEPASKPQRASVSEPSRRGVPFDGPTFKDRWSATNPPPIHQDRRIQVGRRLVVPVFYSYEPDTLAKAEYPATAFIGCSPWWPCHFQLTK